MRNLFVLSSVLLFITACGTFRNGEKESAALQLRVGTSQLQNGAYPQALATLLQAESLDPENAVIQNNLGLAYFVREKYQLAEKHLTRALEITPEYSDARNNLGRILIEQNRYQEAIAELNKVTQDLTYSNPEKPLLNLGIVYFQMKNYQNAKFYFTKTLDLQRDNCLAQSYLGRSLFELKQYPRASEQLDRAVGFCQRSQFDEPHYYSALSYYQAGNKSKASARLEEMIKLYPNGKYIEKAKSMLHEMR